MTSSASGGSGDVHWRWLWCCHSTTMMRELRRGNSAVTGRRRGTIVGLNITLAKCARALGHKKMLRWTSHKLCTSRVGQGQDLPTSSRDVPQARLVNHWSLVYHVSESCRCNKNHTSSLCRRTKSHASASYMCIKICINI